MAYSQLTFLINMENKKINEAKEFLNLARLLHPEERVELYLEIAKERLEYSERNSVCHKSVEDVARILSDKSCLKSVLDGIDLDIMKMRGDGKLVHEIPSYQSVTRYYSKEMKEGRLPNCPTYLASEYPEQFGNIFVTMYRLKKRHGFRF